MLDPRQFLLELFNEAIASALPSKVLSAHLPEKPKGRCIVIGAGKASAAMAVALEVAWPDVEMSGVVVTRYGHAAKTAKIKIIEAAHPVPDSNSLIAAEEILRAVHGLHSDDLVLALMSGGGSSLLVAPSEGLSLADKRSINKALLSCGASISEMNVVRKYLSRIKGGKLAAASYPAHVVTLVISDVPGDDPAIIASGPTIFDTSTAQDALTILRRYEIAIGDAVLRSLSSLSKVRQIHAPDVRMIATPNLMLKAAADFARRHKITSLILGDALEGEALDVGKALSGIARSARSHGLPAQPPCVLLSGGETTVSIHHNTPGRGGRNCEFLLSAGIALEGEANIWGLAGDTDGIDGTEDAAGAILAPDSLSRARNAGLDPRDYLARHDSYALFASIGDLIITGPTLTNVNDFRAFLVTGSG